MPAELATYRLQMSSAFTLDDAAAIVGPRKNPVRVPGKIRTVASRVRAGEAADRCHVKDLAVGAVTRGERRPCARQDTKTKESEIEKTHRGRWISVTCGDASEARPHMSRAGFVIVIALRYTYLPPPFAS